MRKKASFSFPNFLRKVDASSFPRGSPFDEPHISLVRSAPVSLHSIRDPPLFLKPGFLFSISFRCDWTFVFPAGMSKFGFRCDSVDLPCDSESKMEFFINAGRRGSRFCTPEAKEYKNVHLSHEFKVKIAILRRNEPEEGLRTTQFICFLTFFVPQKSFIVRVCKTVRPSQTSSISRD